MFLGKPQDHHHSRNARHERRLSVHMVGQNNEIPRTKIGTKYRGTLTPLEGIRALFGKSLSKATRGPMAHQGNPGALRSPNSTEFLVPENSSKKVMRQSSTISGLRNKRDSGLSPAASKAAEDDKKFTSHLSNPWRRTVTKSAGLTHI